MRLPSTFYCARANKKKRCKSATQAPRLDQLRHAAGCAAHKPAAEIATLASRIRGAEDYSRKQT